MEDSSVAIGNKTDTTLPLGMSSFGTKDRQQFGQDIRLAMPSDEAAIHHRLKVLSQDVT